MPPWGSAQGALTRHPGTGDVGTGQPNIIEPPHLADIQWRPEIRQLTMSCGTVSGLLTMPAKRSGSIPICNLTISTERKPTKLQVGTPNPSGT
jgi:hypothetical protein